MRTSSHFTEHPLRLGGGVRKPSSFIFLQPGSATPEPGKSIATVTQLSPTSGDLSNDAAGGGRLITLGPKLYY